MPDNTFIKQLLLNNRDLIKEEDIINIFINIILKVSHIAQ